MGLRTGAHPTAKSYYGSKGKRWAGKGRKDDNRNWKNHHKGKQYTHNLETKEQLKSHRPVPENIANRLREKSINSDIKKGYPCKAWSGSYKAKYLSLSSIVDISEKFLVKFGGESYRGYAAARAKPYEYDWSFYSSSSHLYSFQKISYQVDHTLTGWAFFEEKVKKIQYRSNLFK